MNFLAPYIIGIMAGSGRRGALQVFGKVGVIWLVTMLSLMAPCAAAPAGVIGLAKDIESSRLFHRVHGFHCRSELGWNPRTGLYERHSHLGICRNYKRCLEIHHRCILVLGRGWDSWKYERWGDDNWRYTECMLERGCY